MDPLSALSVATNVVQFIQFVGELVGKGKEIYEAEDGLEFSLSNLDATTHTLIALNNEIVQSIADHSARGYHSDLQQKIEGICKSCNSIARNLGDTIQKLRPQAKRSKWKSLLQALESNWNRHEIDKLKSQLATQRANLDTALLVSLRYFVPFAVDFCPGY